MSDLVGKRFGSWVCIRSVTYKSRLCAGRANGVKLRAYALCRCDCGKEKEMRMDLLPSRKDPCCKKCAGEKYRRCATKHGMCGTPEWKAYQTLKGRCSRDIWYIGLLCDRWKESFANFFEDMGFKPTPEHELDRIDNTKGYCKENCRWATRHEQMRNIRSNVWMTHPDGRKMILQDWSKELGLGQTCLTKRRKRGWSDERCLTTR